MLHLWNLLREILFKIRFGSTPKYISIGKGQEKFNIPCYFAVVNYLKVNKPLVDEFIEEKNFGVVNRLVFGHLRYYVSGLSKYDGSPEDLTEIIKYIYANLE